MISGIRTILPQRRASRKNSPLPLPYLPFCGENRAMAELAVEKYKVEKEPFYLPVNNEVELFEAAFAAKLPAMLKGPTGCGKTRFVEYMAHRLNRPLITVACHEDLSSTDLVGRFLLEGEETVWHDGPL